MPVSVSDARSNANDQIAHAAKVIGRSTHRAAVFEAIHFGKSRVKSVSEITTATKLPRKRVLEEAIKLVKQHIVHATKKNGETAYERDDFYSAQKARILQLANKPAKLKEYPTKYNQGGSKKQVVTVKIHKSFVQAVYVSIDDISSFAKVANVVAPPSRLRLPEKRFKEGLQRILNQRGVFKDWGGEQNDLYSTNLRTRVGGRRVRTAFGLKGPGTTGKLTPKKMGKNGDQIYRLFQSAADLFVVQYWGDIDQSVMGTMQEFAKAKSISDGKRVLYCLIDGADSDRLAIAYPKAFRKK